MWRVHDAAESGCLGAAGARNPVLATPTDTQDAKLLTDASDALEPVPFFSY